MCKYFLVFIVFGFQLCIQFSYWVFHAKTMHSTFSYPLLFLAFSILVDTMIHEINMRPQNELLPKASFYMLLSNWRLNLCFEQSRFFLLRIYFITFSKNFPRENMTFSVFIVDIINFFRFKTVSFFLSLQSFS